MTPGWASFEIRVPGKWVLAGEHAVLAGEMAVALPHPELGLELRFAPAHEGQALEISPPEGSQVVRDLLESLPELGGALPAGKLELSSTIPIGSGLGSSAALCVALTRWLSGPLRLDRSRWQAFATSLENRFHGKSSGMDVATILAQGPIRFVAGAASPIEVPGRLPRFTFHDTGLRASTRECVQRVQAFRHESPEAARRLDQLMGHAARQGARGLELQDLQAIAEAMHASHECFEGWGLVPEPARKLRNELLAQGALAAKLTGAGNGGFVVALWGTPALSGAH